MILVTGGAGYVGSLLVQGLLAIGKSVRVVDTKWFGNPLINHPLLEFVNADIGDEDKSWLDDIDSVIHLAGVSNDPTADFAPELNIRCNLIATRDFAASVALRATNENRAIRFIFASTCSVYHSKVTQADLNIESMTEDSPVAPMTNYSKSKWLAEIEILNLAEKHPFFCPVIVRKGTIFGLSPRMRFDLVVNTFVMSAWRHQMVTVHGHGEIWRPLLHIRDAVDAYIYLLFASVEATRGKIFNLVHKNYRILELAHWVAEVIEQHKKISIQVKRDRNNENGIRSYYVSGERIANHLGYRPQRGTAEAIIQIWDALESGSFGEDPENDSSFFNIKWLKQHILT